MTHFYKIHQNLLKYWFTLLHFVMDDPVVGGRRRREKGNKLVAPASTNFVISFLDDPRIFAPPFTLQLSRDNGETLYTYF